MRQVIEGRVYDTSTAALLGSASSHLFTSDFGWWSEELYRTTNGRFFLAGEGNAASSWSEPATGGGRMPGSGIRAMSEAEAQEWAERYLSAEEYEAIWTPEEA